jgi:molecular chaperone GrpE (heat shock protein)
MEKVRVSTLKLDEENNSACETPWASERSPEKNLILRIRQLEEDNHKLQNQYVRLSEKYTNLTEEYIQLNLRFTDQMAKQCSADNKR